jgi:protein-S-isoprenylcysteine O-methyltransferase Ste14
MSGMRDALVGRGVRRDRRCVADLDLTKSRQKFDRHGTLVTIGPYRWIRHPFYSSLALAVVANALTAANWFLFVTGGLVFTLLVIRCGREEENLISRFGDQYRIYMQRTGRFLPRIRRQRRL